MSRPGAFPDARLTGIFAVARMLLSGAAATLVVFHAWLFARQMAQSELSDPSLAFRWMLAGGLVVVLAHLWRCGESLAGRKAVAMWILAALLHGPAVAERQIGALETPSLPEAISSVLQAVALAAAAGLLVLGGLTRRLPPRALAFTRIPRPRVWFDRSGAVAARSFAPRPPPRV